MHRRVCNTPTIRSGGGLHSTGSLANMAWKALSRSVDPLRDNAFQAMFASEPVECRPPPDLMVGVLQTRRCIGQQRLQPVLTLDQRQCAQVFPVKEEQIEQEEDQRAGARVGGVLDKVESGPAVGENPTKLAIEVRCSRRQL